MLKYKCKKLIQVVYQTISTGCLLYLSQFLIGTKENVQEIKIYPAEINRYQQ